MITFNDLDDGLKAMIGTPKTIINHADGEDLTVRNEVLKIADRHKATCPNVSRGYIIVRRKYKKVIRNNAEVEINILNQDMINEADTIYDIRYEFDLNGETINVPSNSILLFNGGKLINGTVNINGAQLINVGSTPEDVIETIGSGLKAGTTRWTSDGYIEWWDGTKWFNPYTTLNDVIIQNLNNVADSFNQVNENIKTIVNQINTAIVNEATIRQATDSDLGVQIQNETTARKEADDELQTNIDTVSNKHIQDVKTFQNSINSVSDDLQRKFNTLNSSIANVINGYKTADTNIINLLNEGLKKEADNRTAQIGSEIQGVLNIINGFKDKVTLIVNDLKGDHANLIKKVDYVADIVKKSLSVFNDALTNLHITVQDNQNRIVDINDRMSAYEDNVNKYLVRFRLPDGTLIGGQYVSPGGDAIAPDVVTGATFDKSFINVQEDLLINITY